MMFFVPKRNTGKCLERPYMLSGGPNWELQANVILYWRDARTVCIIFFNKRVPEFAYEGLVPVVNYITSHDHQR